MQSKRKAIKRAVLLILLLALLCGIPLSLNRQSDKTYLPADSLLKAHFIDVGQADCTMLENNGSYFMIDTGEEEDRETVDAYLEKHGVREFAGMILSHPHSDHIGLAADLIERYPVTGPIYMTEETFQSPEYLEIQQLAENKKIKIVIPSPGEKASFENTQIDFMGPIQERNDTNDMSIMAKITFGKNSFFFTGDGGKEEERDMIDAGYEIQADVLKAGHHGSDTSSSYLFLREMNPKYAVISCGKNNSYGHPHKETLSRFRDADTEVFRTDTLGSLVAVSDGVTITFENEKEETEKNVTEPKNDTSKIKFNYIGNVKSKVLHTKTCESLPIEKNREYFKKAKDAVSEGYHSCKRCNP